MEKVIFRVFLCFLLVFSLCTGITFKVSAEGITVNNLKFDVVEQENLPEEILTKLDSIKETRGSYVFDALNFKNLEDTYYVIVCAGTKPTIGHSIEAVKVEDNEGKTVVYVKDQGPSGGAYGMALSYPIAAIKISKVGMSPNFVVKDIEGNDYKVSFIDDSKRKADLEAFHERIQALQRFFKMFVSQS